jgi:hypothetical protein
MGARIDQNRAVIHDRVAVIMDAIFRRHVIIGNAGFGKNGANPDIFAVVIGGAALLDDVAMKTGALIDAENPGDAANHATDDTADYRADRACGAFAFSGAALNSAGHPLGLRDGRKRHGGG